MVILQHKRFTSLNQADNHGWTPIFLIYCNDYIEIVKLLLQQKGFTKLNQANNYGVTP